MEDAKHALDCGVDMIGMILWSKAKRAIAPSLAAQIGDVVKSHRKKELFPKAVGVFVDESADKINSIAKETQIDVIQLHGEPSRSALPDLDPEMETIYVLHVNDEGYQRSMRCFGSAINHRAYMEQQRSESFRELGVN